MDNIIEVNGKTYTLQHPGLREWVKLQSDMVNVVTKKLDMEKLMDYCFEHVVFPEDGEKISLDTVDIDEYTEVWQDILPRFLRGKLESGYTFKTK